MLDCFALLPGVPLLKVAARAEQLDVPQGVATAARERPAMVEMERLDCPAAASASPTEAFGDRLATIRRPPVHTSCGATRHRQGHSSRRPNPQSRLRPSTRGWLADRSGMRVMGSVSPGDIPAVGSSRSKNLARAPAPRRPRAGAAYRTRAPSRVLGAVAAAILDAAERSCGVRRARLMMSAAATKPRRVGRALGRAQTPFVLATLPSVSR